MLKDREKIANYKLIRKIGAGGMGEVYLAEDTRLNRKVALKILSDDAAVDRKRLSRFLQEARLAANLNHPNVCIIYEVNDSAEIPFIAMELVEGETLGERMRRQPLTLNETLEIAVQIADALDEAHRQGVIHRDIKPENIIINRRGQAKMLDFGLAKTFTEIENVSGEAVTQAKTEAGILIGTVQYMSPEHALGKSLDGRTDLWSLGILLYEMVCGETPFKGQTQVAIFDEILHKKPEPPIDLNENLPIEINNIILKLLEKECDFRYQTASDLRADLRRLQRSTEDQISRDKVFSQLPSNGNSGFSKTSALKTQTGKSEIHETLRNTSPVSKRINWNRILATVGILTVFAGTAFAVYFLTSKNKPSTDFEKFETQRVTNLGKVLDAAISADGRYTVYVQDDGGEQSIWLKQVTTGSNVQVVAPTAVTYQGLAFSLDNNWIYYNVWDRKGVGEIFRVPVLGGASQKIVHDCMPGVAVSPKGNKIAFVRSDDKLERTLLLTIDTETREEKTIVSKNRGEAFLSGFAWSRAGDSIAYLGGRWSGTDLPNFFINEVSIATGTEASLWTIPMNWNNFGGGFVWRSDKKDLFLTLAENQSPSNQIWYVSYETGEVRQLTKDFNNYASLGLTPDGENLITVQSDFFLSVWAVPTDRPAEAKRVTDGKTEGIGVAFTPDNRIVYGSTITGNVDLWISDIDGKNKRQLTSDAATEIQPCVAADGKTIVFVSSDNGLLWRIWSMDINGSNRRLIGPLPNQWSAVCSKKENAVLLSNNTDKVGQLQSYSLDTGKSTILLNKDVFRASISPDGKQLAYSFWDRNTQRLSREIFDIETNKTQQFELPVSSVGEYGQNESSAKWMPDGRALSFINREKGVSNVWIKTIGNDAEPRPITTFSENYILTYDWSSDGKWLSVVRGMTMSDVVIIKNEE